jgi:hypothetical protein
MYGVEPRTVESDPGCEENPANRRSPRDPECRAQHDLARIPHRESHQRRRQDRSRATKELSQLHAALRTAITILDADMNGTRQIEILLYDPWHGSRIPEFLETLRSQSSRIEMLLIMLAQNTAIKKRRQNPETWFFLAVHDLFATITGDPEPGIAGPLHRFTQHCAVLTDPRIEVPESENSFQKRLTAALARRTGKILVVPRRVFPGKITTPI